jgi:hypothetical protein
VKASLPLRVLVLAADPQARQALIASRALTAVGAEVHLVTDAPTAALPGETGVPGRLWRHRLDDPLEGLAGAGLDWAMLAASPDMSPGFVARALGLASSLGTRLALLAPAALPPGPAEDIRRLGWLASLVISPGASVEACMRRLLDGAQPRFETWHPAIDSHLARHFLDEPRDGSLLAPVRGPAALVPLAQLPAEALRGRVLRLLTAEALPEEALAPLREKARLDVLPMPEDATRLRLLARAAALLLPVVEQPDDPSPVEAAYLGTPCVGVPNPLWTDWLGETAFQGLKRLAEALAPGEATPNSREWARDMFGLEGAGRRLADLLLRAAPGATSCQAAAMAQVGMQTAEAVPGSPLIAIGAWQLPDGRALVSLRGALPDDVALHQPDGSPADIWRSHGENGDTICHLLLSGAQASLRRGKDAFMHLAVHGLEKVPRWQRPQLILDAARFDGEERVLRGTITTELPLAGIAFAPDGVRWFQCPLQRLPGAGEGPPPRGFSLRMPARIPLDAAAARMLLLNRAGAAIDLLQGWPPRPPSRTA